MQIVEFQQIPGRGPFIASAESRIVGYHFKAVLKRAMDPLAALYLAGFPPRRAEEKKWPFDATVVGPVRNGWILMPSLHFLPT